MNDGYNNNNQNRYEGNGWSKYQLLVLQQLEDHNTVLQNLNKEIVDLKQQCAVVETENKMWKNQTGMIISEIKRDVDYVLYDEKGTEQRLASVEREIDVEEQVSTKNKATWALYGSIAMFVANVIIQITSIILKAK